MTQQAHEPIVKCTLGPNWQYLPTVLQRNFDLRPGQTCAVNLEGTMYEVWHSPLAKLFIFPGRLFGALVPYQGNNIPIRIEIRTYADDTRFMYWRRIHRFPGRPDCVFSSKMEYVKDNELVECVRLGLGMCMKVSLEGRTLKFVSPCYQWNILGLRLRIPTWLLLGRGQIIEQEVSDEQFEMFFEINHPWFGRTFRYSGIFRFT
jgi:hypothetical protein